MKYDVAVIGAGPAGAYCAKTLAEKGMKVLLIDKESFPREKVCGGLISAKALQVLKKDPLDKYLKNDLTNPIHKITLSCDAKEASFETDQTLGLVVQRKHFDEALLNMAQDKGANFIGQCEYMYHRSLKSSYKIYTSRGVFFSDYLIGADGVYSEVAKKSDIRQCFLKSEMGFALSCIIPKDLIHEADGVEFTFLKILGGMGWCFSGKDFANIGVGGYAPASKRIYQMAKQLVMRKLKCKSIPFELRGHFLPAGGIQRQIAFDRIFLIGDAAGFVDPFSGEGVYYALRSGELAAEMIEKNKGAQYFQEACYRMFLKEFRFSALLSVVLGDRSKILNKFGNHELLEAFYKIMTTPPETGCYKNIALRIVKYGISPTFPFLWLQSLLFA